jgi:hypothetical protein
MKKSPKSTLTKPHEVDSRAVSDSEDEEGATICAICKKTEDAHINPQDSFWIKCQCNRWVMAECEGLTMNEKSETKRPDWLCLNCRPRTMALESFLGHLFIEAQQEIIQKQVGSHDDNTISDSELILAEEGTEKQEDVAPSKNLQTPDVQTINHNKALRTRLPRERKATKEREDQIKQNEEDSLAKMTSLQDIIATQEAEIATLQAAVEAEQGKTHKQNKDVEGAASQEREDISKCKLASLQDIIHTQGAEIKTLCETIWYQNPIRTKQRLPSSLP